MRMRSRLPPRSSCRTPTSLQKYRASRLYGCKASDAAKQPSTSATRLRKQQRGRQKPATSLRTSGKRGGDDRDLDGRSRRLRNSDRPARSLGLTEYVFVEIRKGLDGFPGEERVV